MTQKYYNPFAGIDLVAPVEQRDVYDRYCQRPGVRTTVDQSPFPRMVDFWFAGMALAARRNLTAVDLGKQETFKFIEGSIFDRDPWRVQTVMLVALSIEDNIEVGPAFRFRWINSSQGAFPAGDDLLYSFRFGIRYSF